MIDAPVMMPVKPLGANGCQLAGLTQKAPMATKAMTRTILSTTMMLLKRADSLTPTTSSTVRSATMAPAGRLKTMGMPKTCGACAKHARGWRAPG